MQNDKVQLSAAAFGGRSNGQQAGLSRRTLLGAVILANSTSIAARASPVTLRNAPILIGGDWGGSLPAAALRVVEIMRQACLGEIALKSDRQPARIHVENVRTGPPHVWLHFDKQPVADIVVDIGERDWCKLAYQFGHELGHVMANSWGPGCAPRPGSQWLEESLVESFSLWGLGRLAQIWRTEPPFPGDNAFATSIETYREQQLTTYRQLAPSGPEASNGKEWFREKQKDLALANGLGPIGLAIAPLLVDFMTKSSSSIEALGALNRWPDRSSLRLPEYLDAWIASCTQIKASLALPQMLKAYLL